MFVTGMNDTKSVDINKVERLVVSMLGGYNKYNFEKEKPSGLTTVVDAGSSMYLFVPARTVRDGEDTTGKYVMDIKPMNTNDGHPDSIQVVLDDTFQDFWNKFEDSVFKRPWNTLNDLDDICKTLGLTVPRKKRKNYASYFEAIIMAFQNEYGRLALFIEGQHRAIALATAAILGGEIYPSMIGMESHTLKYSKWSSLASEQATDNISWIVDNVGKPGDENSLPLMKYKSYGKYMTIVPGARLADFQDKMANLSFQVKDHKIHSSSNNISTMIGELMSELFERTGPAKRITSINFQRGAIRNILEIPEYKAYVENPTLDTFDNFRKSIHGVYGKETFEETSESSKGKIVVENEYDFELINNNVEPMYLTDFNNIILSGAWQRKEKAYDFHGNGAGTPKSKEFGVKETAVKGARDSDPAWRTLDAWEMNEIILLPIVMRTINDAMGREWQQVSHPLACAYASNCLVPCTATDSERRNINKDLKKHKTEMETYLMEQMDQDGVTIRASIFICRMIITVYNFYSQKDWMIDAVRNAEVHSEGHEDKDTETLLGKTFES